MGLDLLTRPTKAKYDFPSTFDTSGALSHSESVSSALENSSAISE
jgi:hypothetical protein